MEGLARSPSISVPSLKGLSNDFLYDPLASSVVNGQIQH